MSTLTADRRGQSEVLGVVLILGITFLSVGTVVALGGEAIDQTEKTVRIQSAEQAMSQLDSKAARVALGPSPQQSTRIPLSESAQLRSRSTGAWMNVTLVDSGGNVTTVMNASMGGVVYTLGETHIAYQGGGVWKRSSGGSVMVAPPEFHYRGRTLTLPLVVVNSSEKLGERVLVTGSNDATVEFPNGSRTNPITATRVNVTVRSEYYKAWGDFLESRTGGEVVYNHPRETVTVTFVVPSDKPSIAAGVIAGTPSSSLEISETAVLDSYNSSNGDYLATERSATNVIVAGDLVLHEYAIVEGDVEVGEEVTLKEHTRITGNVSYGTVLNDDTKNTTIGGWTAPNASVSAPGNVIGLIDEKRTQFKSNNDNDDPDVDVDESTNTLEGCDSGCTLDAGQYYLSEIDLGEGHTLILNTTAGDIDIAVAGDIDVALNSDIKVVGENRVNVFIEGSVTLHENVEVTVPQDDSTQFWMYLNPDAAVDLKENVTYVGVIYGPGGERSGATISPAEYGHVYGALVGDVEVLHEHMRIHYDAALRHAEVIEGTGGQVAKLTYLHVSVVEVKVTDADA